MIGRPPRDDRLEGAVVAPVEGDPGAHGAGVGIRIGENGEHSRRLLSPADLAEGLGQGHTRPAVVRVRRDVSSQVFKALVRLPDGVAGQAPVEHVVEGHRGQPRQGLEVLIELAAAEQHPVDVNKLPVCLDECGVELERFQQ